MTIENRLGDEQSAQAQAFLERLSLEDQSNIQQILAIIEDLSKKYDEQTWPNHDAIFGVYVIGGNVHKEGPRPDIDLLIVGNAVFDSGYDWLLDINDWEQVKGDWVMGSINDHFITEGFTVELPSQIPDEYDMGLRVKDIKMMMRLKPPIDSKASPLDIVYMKLNYMRPEERIQTHEDFYKVDKDTQGIDLGRIALLEETIRKSRPIRP